MSPSEEKSKLREFLWNERPTIDAALKSFASWMMAHTATKNMTTNHDDDDVWTTVDIMKAARWLSLSINQHVVSVALLPKRKLKQPPTTTRTSADSTDEITRAVVAQVWNEVVGQKNKVTKTLGRTSLRVVWSDMDLQESLVATTNVKAQESWKETKGPVFLEYFERFLFADTTQHGSPARAAAQQEHDGSDFILADAHLIWDSDGGKGELARRATQRQEQAAQRRNEQGSAAPAAAASSVLIEELKEDE